MKNILFVAFFICNIFTTTNAQTKVPSAVTEAFSKKFPTATNVKWEKESKTEFEANFTENKTEKSVNYSAKGDWLETETTITFEQLPAKVQKTFKNTNKNSKVKTVAKIETSTGETNYEIEVKKAIGTVEYFYNSDGKLID